MKLVIDGSVVSTISSEQIHPWGMVIVPVSVYGALSEGPHSLASSFKRPGIRTIPQRAWQKQLL